MMILLHMLIKANCLILNLHSVRIGWALLQFKKQKTKTHTPKSQQLNIIKVYFLIMQSPLMVQLTSMWSLRNQDYFDLVASPFQVRHPLQCHGKGLSLAWSGSDTYYFYSHLTGQNQPLLTHMGAAKCNFLYARNRRSTDICDR